MKLKEFVKNNLDNGLTHIVIDDGKDRPDFFKILMKNEKSIEYLEKVYDSKENGFNYHVKVFEIDFSKIK